MSAVITIRCIKYKIDHDEVNCSYIYVDRDNLPWNVPYDAKIVRENTRTVAVSDVNAVFDHLANRLNNATVSDRYIYMRDDESPYLTMSELVTMISDIDSKNLLTVATYQQNKEILNELAEMRQEINYIRTQSEEFGRILTIIEKFIIEQQ